MGCGFEIDETSLTKSPTSISFLRAFICVLLLLLIQFRTTRLTSEVLSIQTGTVQVETQRDKYLVGCSSSGWAGYVLKEFYYFFGYLEKANWKYLDHKYFDSMNNVELLELNPKVLFFCEVSISYYLQLPMDKLRNAGTVIVAWSDDIHMYNRFPRDNLTAFFNQTDVIVSPYAYIFNQFFDDVLAPLEPHERPAIYWNPHSANPEFFSETMESEPLPKVFLSGNTDVLVYPIRHWLKTTYMEKYPERIELFVHPGYGVLPENQTAIYAAAMKRCIAAITCTSIRRFILAKVFEIPATGSLLLVNNELSAVLERLGFIHKVNYVGYDNDHPELAIEWVLNPDNRDHVNEIRRLGYELVKSKHQTINRVVDFEVYLNSNLKTVSFPLPIPPARSGKCPLVGLDDYDCVNMYQLGSLYHAPMT